MRVTAIVLAGGRGSRMNSTVPKQYMEVCGHPVIYYTLKAFEESETDDIILVTGAGDEAYCQEKIVAPGQLKKVSKITAGGSERFLSVYNGLLACPESDIVLVHDGARCLIRPELINRIIANVREKRAVIAAVPVVDTIKAVNDRLEVTATPDRRTLWSIQTPQAFYREELLKAHEKMFESYNHEYGSIPVTDDAGVMEAFSQTPVNVIMGDYTNIKITTPDDLRTVENELMRT